MTTVFHPDFLFSTITNVHFGGGGYCVIFFSGLAPPITRLKSGEKIASSIALPLSAGVNALGTGVAVFGQGKFSFHYQVDYGDPTQIAPSIFCQVFTKSPFDKLGQQFFSDYQGTDQTLRLQFGKPPNVPGPVPDNTNGATGLGNSRAIYRIDVDVSKVGKGNVTVTDVTTSGG
jgi:hypothetical protein